MDRSKEKFISDLKNSVLDEIDQFKFGIGEIMEERIEKGVEDEECKEIFKNELIQGIETLHENIKRRFKECGERFDEQIKEDIERFKERIKDSLAMLKRICIDSGNFNFNFDFNIDNGIDGFALGASIVGLVLLLITPIVGEFVLIAGVGLAFVGIGKAVWGFFDSDYKKSQQRKEADKNLDRFCEKITETMKSQIESYKKGASEMIENLKASLNDLIVCYERMREGLIKAGEDLWHLDNRIKTTLKQRIAQ